MYVASNTKLIFFLLVCLSLLLVVEIWSEMTAMVTIGVLGFFIIVMLKNSLFNLKAVRQQINTKRVIIFVSGFIVGFAYLYYQNNTNYVQFIDKIIPLTLMTLFFIVILININIHSTKFFSVTNLLWCLVGAGIIWGHFYFDESYQRHYWDSFSKIPDVFRYFLQDGFFKMALGLGLLYFLYYLQVSTIKS